MGLGATTASAAGSSPSFLACDRLGTSLVALVGRLLTSLALVGRLPGRAAVIPPEEDVTRAILPEAP